MESKEPTEAELQQEYEDSKPSLAMSSRACHAVIDAYPRSSKPWWSSDKDQKGEALYGVVMRAEHRTAPWSGLPLTERNNWCELALEYEALVAGVRDPVMVAVDQVYQHLTDHQAAFKPIECAEQDYPEIRKALLRKAGQWATWELTRYSEFARQQVARLDQLFNWGHHEPEQGRADSVPDGGGGRPD